MKNILGVLIAVWAVASGAQTPVEAVVASEAPPSYDYAHGSVSVLGSAALGVGLASASQSGSAFQAVGLMSGLAVRFVTRRGFAVEPRLGLDGALLTGGAGLYALVQGRMGLGAGWAFSLSRALALTPMVSYEAAYVVGGIAGALAGLTHAVALELPLSIFLGRDVFIELYARGGGTLMLGQVVPSLGAGYRLGMVW
ncbi:MAG: hypothetical protein IPJ65_39585 [Archangiaceae bacterium]|nr:hypothetical protein [Archangiaceae bacterium]